MKVRKYNRNARPVKRHTTVTEVAFTMFIRKIVDVDIQTAVMTTYSTLYMVRSRLCNISDLRLCDEWLGMDR